MPLRDREMSRKPLFPLEVSMHLHCGQHEDHESFLVPFLIPNSELSLMDCDFSGECGEGN